jgi:hypothetical protein
MQSTRPKAVVVCFSPSSSVTPLLQLEQTEPQSGSLYAYAIGRLSADYTKFL